MEDIFRAFDQRGDQSIDLSDLGHVFRCMKVNLTQAELYEIEAQVYLSLSTEQKRYKIGMFNS